MKSAKKKLAISIAFALILIVAGCNEGGPGGNDLAKDTGTELNGSSVGESYTFEVRMTEKNQYDLVKAQPPFLMEESLERENLIRRYQYLNNRNNLHHVYMVSNTGSVVAYMTAQGKVSSVNSKLTNDQQIVASNQCLKQAFREDESGCFQAVESPQMDGSYGTNGDAIFFFTPEGEYVEWNGIYMVSEEPKNIQSAVTLIDDSNDRRNSGSGGNSTNASA